MFSEILCVICHKLIHINKNQIPSDHVDYIKCSNDHFIHRNCLKHWLLDHKNCPVCHFEYDPNTLQSFSDFISQIRIENQKKEEEACKQAEIKKQKEQEIIIDPEIIDKYINARTLIEQKDYKSAIGILWDLADFYAKDQKKPIYQMILYELGKNYYLIGNYALAINQLMNLVKINFKFPMAFYYIGISYEKLGFPDKARWAYERVIPMFQELLCNNSKIEKYSKFVDQRIHNLFTPFENAPEDLSFFGN